MLPVRFAKQSLADGKLVPKDVGIERSKAWFELKLVKVV